MDLIHKMKKREFLEMMLKTIIAVLASFIVVILMEGMIYGIELNALKNSNSVSRYNDSVAYCLSEGDDNYHVIYYNPDQSGYVWSSSKTNIMSKQDIETMKENGLIADIVWHAPNAFEFSINTVHYAVMAVFMLIVVGFFVYRFILLKLEYDKIEKRFKDTGEIEIVNF